MMERVTPLLPQKLPIRHLHCPEPTRIISLLSKLKAETRV